MSEDILWNLLDTIPTNISIWKKDELIYANNRYYRSVGVDTGDIEKLREVIFREEHNLIHPEDYDYCKENTVKINEELGKGNYFNREVRMKDAYSDQYRWYNTYLVIAKDNGSDVTIELDEDITEKKLASEKLSEALKEKEILLKEIHHRVKNNFQIISSLLRLQQSKLKDRDMKDMLLESENRVKSMAMVHESLYRSEGLASIDFAAYVRNLMKNLVEAYSGRTRLVKFNIEANNCMVGVDEAIPCSLIITELVSNSFKHGFDDSMKPEINISLSLEDEQYTLIVKDNGVGFTDSFFNKESDTLGIMIITTLAKQIGGKVQFHNNPGAETIINFKG
jgi:two-component sensor histidine kinase